MPINWSYLRAICRQNITALQTQVVSQASALRECQRHLEDMNRGRHNNVRIRGLPEALQHEDVRVVVQTL